MVPAAPVDGKMISNASIDNEVSIRKDAMPKTPELMSMNQETNSGGASDYSNSVDPNEPGNVEPEDSMFRYGKLFGLLAA
jgi:hypothetical protein